MLYLDVLNAFGSAFHVQLRNNFTKLRLHPLLKEVILDSSNGKKVKIVILNRATNPIDIQRRVKQGCPLLTILFDNGINPLIEPLSSDDFKKQGY
jgi:hypothetical protein